MWVGWYHPCRLTPGRRRLVVVRCRRSGSSKRRSHLAHAQTPMPRRPCPDAHAQTPMPSAAGPMPRRAQGVGLGPSHLPLTWPAATTKQEIRNPNTRNPKQIQNPNVPKTKTDSEEILTIADKRRIRGFGHLNFCHSNLFRIWCFGFRIWNMRAPCAHPAR